MTRKQTIVVLLVLVLGVAMGTMDAEAAYSPPEICAACHGDNGASQHPDIPIIGGLSAFVIEENLFAFRAQERPCRTTFLRNGEPGSATTNMCELAADLSDDDIVAIAAHYAEQPFVPAIQATDEGKAELGASVHHRECRFCHGEGGSDPADHASILAGQWMPYLAMEFNHFRAGTRWMPRKMDAKVKALTDEELDGLLHYYGSRPGTSP